MIFTKTHSTQIINTVLTITLSKYQSIQNLTTKIKTDRILSHHILTHPNSAIIHHFFHHFMKAVAVLMFGLSTLYNRACLHIGQNIEIHSKKIIITAIINHNILNLCTALTKYMRALDTSNHELY